ncbi:hypothetical protein IEO21_00838 [Rhodonia placenta]|uniref:RRM domain-containing protein n=1 Tax=Rhodonia placenta TaxID=104341 RepID=A0A8H7PAT6_9APHY|nr:hypothetical protein IEO21_00838 [Postia placenta]
MSVSSHSPTPSSSHADSSPSRRKRKLRDVDSDSGSASDSDNSGDENESGSGSDPEASEPPVLSHAEQRRQRKKQEKSAAQPSADAEPTKEKSVKNTAELAPSKVPKRQNSVWVGNMSFKTTPEALRQFFDGVGEITRIHMPTKLANPGPEGKGVRKENRGFAYVDFSTPDAKTVAITRSENPLDGRRLLIKDGDDFNGRPTAASADAQDGASKSSLSGHTKTAQKILSAQKQPAGPTLFLGNLGFEATEQSIRTLFDSYRPKAVGGADADPDADADAGAEKPKPWIRKVRLGTFEDSGKCKGWAFIDFTSTEHATTALVSSKIHFLDGRKLVVEYASPDAVRRGGNFSELREKRIKGDKGSYDEQRPRRKPSGKLHQSRTTANEADAPMGGEEQQEVPAKRRRIEDASQSFEKRTRDGKPQRVRTKPGAALALAKRETAAIVPSQGKKIVF